MTINCNVTGSERKRLAQVLGAILLFEPVYMKAPTFAYVLNNYTIDKIGTIFCPEVATPEIVRQIVTKLTDEGFSPKIAEEETPAESPTETPDAVPEAAAEGIPEAEAVGADVDAETPVATEESAKESQSADIPAMPAAEDESEKEPLSDADNTVISIDIPRDKLPDDALARLRTMVSNKAELFKRALLTDALPIEVSEKEISFPWFPLTGTPGEAEAYAQFITHLCKMAIEQTRVLDKPYDGDNDRFAMRIFMVRLGMKGAQFALARKLMMKNLTGNSGWRYGAPPKKAEEASTARTEIPEVLIHDTPSEAGAMEETEAPVPEDVSNTTTEGTAEGGDPVPDEAIPDPSEATPSEATPSEDAATNEG